MKNGQDFEERGMQLPLERGKWVSEEEGERLVDPMTNGEGGVT